MRWHATPGISPQSTHLPAKPGSFRHSVLLAIMLICCSQMAAAQDRIYWDGGNTAQNGAVDGGDGTWDEVSTNWTNQTGTANYAADGLGALPDRRFTGTGGTVNVTATTPQAGRMQFSSSGYRLQGAAVDVQGRLVLSTGTTTTIANALTADGLESASTGALIIDATGRLQIDMGESVAAIAGNITNNGSLVFNRSDDLTLSNPISGSGLIRHQGTGILTLDGIGATYSGNVEVTNGTLRPFLVEILGVVTLDGGTLSELRPTDPPAEIALGAGGGTIDVPSVTFGTGNNISGIGKLTKTGAGELRLKGDRTFSGGMDINQGRVVFRDSSAAVTTPFGSGPITVAAGARLDLADRMSVPNAISLAETSVLRIATTFPTTLSGNINFGGGSEAITLLGGTNANRTVNFSGILSNGGFVASATAISTARTLEFSGAAANTYTGLTRIKTVAGAGLRFRLNKSANVTAVPGDLTVDAGTQVIVAANEQIADTATVQLNADSVMTLGEGASVGETVDVLNGSGAVELTSTSNITITSGTFSGAISGDGALIKQGAGTLLLSGDSTYTGTTTVQGGLLQVSGSLASDVTVRSGAALSGSGTVSSLRIDGGGKVSPGASAGTLATGGLMASDTAIFDMELAAPGTTGGGVNDLIQVTGDLALNGVLNISDLGGLAAGTYTLMTYTGALNGDGLSIGTTPAGFVYSIDTSQANKINLEVATAQAAITLSHTGFDFGTRSTAAAATTRILTISSTGNIPLAVGAITGSGVHASEFTITADACSNTSLAAGSHCSVTVSQEGGTAGLRTAQLNIASDAVSSPHVVTLQVRRVGDPTITGLHGSSQVFRLGAAPLLLDGNASTVVAVPEALNLEGGSLSAEFISGAQATEDRLSFSTADTVSLTATVAGSNVLVDGIVIGTLDNAIAVGEVLRVTFNANATSARVQTLIRAITFQNTNTTTPVNGVREIRITLSNLSRQTTATVSVDVQQTKFILSATALEFGTHGMNPGALTQALTIRNDGNITVSIGALSISGDHAAEFTITADSCSNIVLNAAATCDVTVRFQGTTSGLRSAQLAIPSDADGNPHHVDLRVRIVGLPVLGSLNGDQLFYRVNSGALVLDAGNDAVLSMPGAMGLSGATLGVAMIAGANAAEDVLSLQVSGAVALAASTAGSNVLVDGVVIGTLDSAIAVGEALSITFNADAITSRGQTLVRAITYQNLNTVNPATGLREARITLSYLGQTAVATATINVQPLPVEPAPPGPTLPAVLTGAVSGNITGEPQVPVIIRDATVTSGSSLAYVIVESDVILEPGVILGDGVIFKSPGIIQLLQNIALLLQDGARITQLANGHLSIVSDNYRAMLKPAEIVQASEGQPPGVYFGDNADIYLITASGLGIRAFALHVDADNFRDMLSALALQPSYTPTGRMIVDMMAAAQATGHDGNVLALQKEDFYFSGRADLLAMAVSVEASPGLVEYAVNGLGSVLQLSTLFVATDNNALVRQDLVPAPANWSELRQALQVLPGVTAVTMDTRGIIQVSVGDVLVRGVMDYIVVRSSDAGPGELKLNLAGDLSGNGIADYHVIYANGDRQTLFVYLPD